MYLLIYVIIYYILLFWFGADGDQISSDNFFRIWNCLNGYGCGSNSDFRISIYRLTWYINLQQLQEYIGEGKFMEKCGSSKNQKHNLRNHFRDYLCMNCNIILNAEKHEMLSIQQLGHFLSDLHIIIIV